MYAYKLLLQLFLLSMSIKYAFGESDMSKYRVVVLHFGQNETSVLLTAELSALGYVPILIDHPDQALWTDQIRVLLKNHNASALINATSLEKQVDVWTVDPESGDTRLVVTTVKSRGENMSEASMILKSVEALRAGLMIINSPKASESNVELQNEAPKVDEDRRVRTRRVRGSIGSIRNNDENSTNTQFKADLRRLFLALGPAVNYGFGDFPPEWQLSAKGGIRVTDRIAVTIGGFLPTAPISKTTEYGIVEMRNSSFGAGLRLNLSPPYKRSSLWVELSAEAHFSRIKSNAIKPYISMDNRLAVFSPVFSAGLSVWLGNRSALETIIHVGDFMPEFVIVNIEDKAEYSKLLFGGALRLVFNLL